MKVLHILNHSIPHIDGYCVRSENIVRFVSELGVDLAVLTSPRHEPETTGDIEHFGGIRYYRSADEPVTRLPVLDDLTLIRRMTKRIIEVARTENAQILHCHSPCRWGLAAVRAGKQLGIPVAYEIRGFWEDSAVDQGMFKNGSLKYRMSRYLETKVCRSADIVITIAEAMKQELMERGIPGQKIVLSPNGVDLEQFAEPVNTPSESDQVPGRSVVKFGYVGSLYAWEGVDDFIRAATLIADKIPNAEFIVAGGGPMESELRQLAQHSGGQVEMLGRLPREAIPDLYASLDVLVYPRKSNRTTELVTPLKPLEAMAMGKAVVGSNVGGIREIIVDGTGLLFQAGDVDEFAQQCIRMGSEPDLRHQLSSKAREYVAEHRDWRVLSKRYVSLYEQLLGSEAMGS